MLNDRANKPLPADQRGNDSRDIALAADANMRGDLLVGGRGPPRGMFGPDKFQHCRLLRGEASDHEWIPADGRITRIAIF